MNVNSTMRTMTYDITAILFISWPQLWFCERLYECVYICTRCWFLSKSVEPKEWKKWVLREIDELNRKQKKNREFTAEEVLSSFLWALSYDRKKIYWKRRKRFSLFFPQPSHMFTEFIVWEVTTVLSYRQSYFILGSVYAMWKTQQHILCIF